ncbi:MAG: hypothetical protein JXJ17_07505 [Anaerolineae bacterium]|nr:hypothetical protein [Anaerolineae bacterium]
MPQLVKGGKWVFGWTIVNPSRLITIPPAAWIEYGFQVGDKIAFLKGSKTSGGFAIGRMVVLTQKSTPIIDHALAHAEIAEAGRIALPPTINVHTGDRLLVVRGSGLALGFLIKGPIIDEAINHPEIETFTCD